MRKKCKNEIFNFLCNTKLGKELFELKESSENELLFTTISLIDSPLSFIIRTSNESFDLFDYQFVPFSPSYQINSLYPPQGWAEFDEVFDAFKNWVNNHVNSYIEELHIPDLWSEYKQSNKSLNFKEIEFENKDIFNFEEKEQIKMAINDLKLLIHSNLKTSDEEQKLVNSRLDYLVDAMNRLNKFDWKSVAISTVMSITIALSLDTSKGQILFDLFKRVFSIVPLLLK